MHKVSKYEHIFALLNNFSSKRKCKQMSSRQERDMRDKSIKREVVRSAGSREGWTEMHDNNGCFIIYFLFCLDSSSSASTTFVLSFFPVPDVAFLNTNTLFSKGPSSESSFSDVNISVFFSLTVNWTSLCCELFVVTKQWSTFFTLLHLIDWARKWSTHQSSMKITVSCNWNLKNVLFFLLS